MDPALWIELAVFVVLMVLSGFFSSTETALFSLSSFHLDQMRSARNPRLELIERLRSEPRRLIVTILIGNEFVNVSASVISAAMIIHLFGAENEMINLLVMVPIIEEPSPDGLRATDPTFQHAVEDGVRRELRRRDLSALALDPGDRDGWLTLVEEEVITRLAPPQLPLL